MLFSKTSWLAGTKSTVHFHRFIKYFFGNAYTVADNNLVTNPGEGTYSKLNQELRAFGFTCSLYIGIFKLDYLAKCQLARCHIKTRVNNFYQGEKG